MKATFPFKSEIWLNLKLFFLAKNTNKIHFYYLKNKQKEQK
jgi:hypothetical protein